MKEQQKKIAEALNNKKKEEKILTLNLFHLLHFQKYRTRTVKERKNTEGRKSSSGKKRLSQTATTLQAEFMNQMARQVPYLHAPWKKRKC